MGSEAKYVVNSSNDEDDDWDKMGIGSKTKYVLKNISVEPILAFFQVSSVLSSLTTQNLNLQKACRVNLKLENATCYALENKNMSSFPNEERQVQQLVSSMLIWQTVIQSSIPCVLVIFIGSWSDRNKKRKPCMLFPIVGEIVRNLGLIMCVYYFNEFTMEVAGLVESIPSSIAGGLTVLYLAAFSYIGDVSSMKNRTLRVGLMNLLFGTAWPIGAALSGILFQKLGFFGVYYISTTLYIISLLYGMVCIKEQPKNSETIESTDTPNTWVYLFKDFFDLKHIKDALHVTFKKGVEQRRVKTIMLLFIVVVVQGPMQGEAAVGYLYARVRLQWNELEYSYFSTIQFLLNITGVGLSVGVLSHLLKVDDAIIGVLACSSKVLASIVFAFAETEKTFYTGCVVDMMSGVSYIVVRSILSKIIPKAELGQVSAVIAVIETIVPIVYKPLYSAIYGATLNTFPGAFYLFGSAMLTPSVFIYIWMYRIKKNDIEEEKTVGDEIVMDN